jgi:hypothetical protein
MLEKNKPVTVTSPDTIYYISKTTSICTSVLLVDSDSISNYSARFRKCH